MSKKLVKRQSAAKARAAGALSLFQRAAGELEAAAQAHEVVSTDASDKADEYTQISLEAAAGAAQARSNAQALRNLFGSAA